MCVWVCVCERERERDLQHDERRYDEIMMECEASKAKAIRRSRRYFPSQWCSVSFYLQPGWLNTYLPVMRLRDNTNTPAVFVTHVALPCVLLNDVKKKRGAKTKCEYDFFRWERNRLLAATPELAVRDVDTELIRLWDERHWCLTLKYAHTEFVPLRQSTVTLSIPLSSDDVGVIQHKSHFNCFMSLSGCTSCLSVWEFALFFALRLKRAGCGIHQNQKVVHLHVCSCVCVCLSKTLAVFIIGPQQPKW